jgi:hypothetical protein
MEQNNLASGTGPASVVSVAETFKKAFADYKENFSFSGFVYFPIAVLSVLGIFLPGIIGGLLVFVAGVLSVFATPGFISAISKNFYSEATLPLQKLKLLYKDGAKYIVPVFWIGILTALCVLFGFSLLIVPGIWLSVILGYSTYVLIFEGRRGVEALAYSYIYAKDNFWFIFKRLLVMGIGMAIVGSIFSGIFPPEKKNIRDLTGDEYSSLPMDLKDNEYVKKMFNGEEPYVVVRQKGDEALSAIFNNIFIIPFAAFVSVGIFNFLKEKNGALATEEEVKKSKKKIKIFAWLGILLPAVVILVLALIFGSIVVSSLRQILP